MAIAFNSAHHITAEWTNATGVTTSAIDTSGDNFIVVGCTSSNSISLDATAVSDNKGNTYTLLIGPITNGDSVAIYYAQNPTVGLGHTFTITTEANDFGVINVGGFSGMLTSGVTDQSASATGTGTTATAGSQTTTNADDLIIAIAQFGGGTDITFTPQGTFATVDASGNLDTTASGWMGYKIRASIGTESGNTVSQSGSSAVWAGAQASFKGAAAATITEGAPPPPVVRIRMRQY